MVLKQKHHKVGDLRQQKLIVSQFWQPEVQDQDIDGASFRGKNCGRLFLPLVACWQPWAFPSL
jgi:hypothetical protein